MKIRSRSFPTTRHLRPLLAAACALIGMLTTVHAQTPGTLDKTFAVGVGPDAEVDSLALQSDGKIIVGGQYLTIDGVAHEGIARLTTTGSLDTTFNPGTGINNDDNTGVYAVAIQSDGKILVAGLFSTFNGATHDSIVRLNTNGGIDTTFTGKLGFGDTVRAMAVQSDGKILIGGSFSTVDGVARQNIARLYSNGTLDTTFVPGGNGGVEGESVNAIVVQPDGKIVIGGEFSSENSAPYDNIERLYSNGSIDNSFNTGDGTDDSVYAVALQSDGKVVIAGFFHDVNDVEHDSLARLNADGSVDSTFNPNLGTQDFRSYALALQTDGKIIVAGSAAEDGIPGIARYNANGTTDTTYKPGTGIGGDVHALLLQTDNKLIVGGNIGTVNNEATSNVFRLYGGSALPAFFTGEAALGNGVYYLAFPNKNYFGYYSFLSDPAYIYHFDLGYEYVFDAADGKSGVYFYDFKSKDYFYTSPTFPFPYLYDFGLKSVVYYYPDPKNAGHYNTNGIRYFYVFSTGKIISK